jgi:hypothetical protein
MIKALSCAILEVSELQQLGSVVPPNLLLVRLVHRDVIVPVASITKRLERVVNREQNAISSNLAKTELQGRRGEVATGGDPEVLLEILADSLLA